MDNLPINYALLQLTSTYTDSTNAEQEVLPSIVHALSTEELECYKRAKSCIEELALYLKPNGQIAGLFSRPMQRKLVTLINCQLVEEEGRARSMRAARSLGERTVTELILQHQNPQQLSANLWAAVRARGCQFLGPAMQEEVLKLVLLALEDGVSLCRKVLVMFVVQRLEPTFPQASKTSIGHVVQLLYRASCFIVSKRDGDSSLMQLKEEFRTYKSLRKEHDAQIVQIATEAGLRIAPDQWSALLYGDPDHKSDMQSLIDKQQSPESFGQSVQELMIALQRTGDPANLSALRANLNSLASIDSSPDSNTSPTWIECSDAIEGVKFVVKGLVEFILHHGNRKSQDYGHLSHTTRYKISFCRDLSIRGNCPRGQNCTFAHTDEELERYRSRMKKHTVRPLVKPSFPGNAGPNPRVNISQPTYANQQDIQSRFKSISYRSENSLNSLHQTPAKQAQHLTPTYPAGASSSSTPNLSQSQLSPKPMSGPPTSQMHNRFNYNRNIQNCPPIYNPSSPPNVAPNSAYHLNHRIPQQQYVKTSPKGYSQQYSPQYHIQMPMSHSPSNHSPPAMMKPPSANSGYYHQQPHMMRNEDFSNNNGMAEKYQMNWRSGNGNNDKSAVIQKLQSHLMAHSPVLQEDSNQTSPVARTYNELAHTEMNRFIYRNKPSGEIDSESDIWSGVKQQPVFQFDTEHAAKDRFTRSDSILTSSTDDEYSYDAMAPGNKFGPIGINTSRQFTDNEHRDWSGLQNMMTNLNFNGDALKMATLNHRMSNGNMIRPLKAVNFSSGDMNVSVHVIKTESFSNFQILQYRVLNTAQRPSLDNQKNIHFANHTDSMQNNWTDGKSNNYDFSGDSLDMNGMCSKKIWDLLDE